MSAAKHTIVKFGQSVTVLLICFSVSPCGLVGARWVTVNICAPAVRTVTLLSTLTLYRVSEDTRR